MSTYTAHARRDEGWWVITVDEVDGLFTQTKRLDQIPEMVRDALALFPEIEKKPTQAKVNVVVDGAVGDRARQALSLRDEAQQLSAVASQTMVMTAKELADQDLPFRDIGNLLDISFQHAQKLVTKN